MSEDTKQETAQEGPSNVTENKPESPSNDGLLSEVMAKKEKIKTLEAELAKRVNQMTKQGKATLSRMTDKDQKKQRGDQIKQQIKQVKDSGRREIQQIQKENAPDTSDAMKRYKSGKAGFTDIAHLKAKGLIKRSDGTKKKSDKYK